MKTMIMIIIYILLLWWLPGCDEVTPDYPINVVDDGLYLVLNPDDSFRLIMFDSFCSVSVSRPYGEDAMIVFDERPTVIINHVHISRGILTNGNL